MVTIEGLELYSGADLPGMRLGSGSLEADAGETLGGDLAGSEQQTHAPDLHWPFFRSSSTWAEFRVMMASRHSSEFHSAVIERIFLLMRRQVSASSLFGVLRTMTMVRQS